MNPYLEEVLVTFPELRENSTLVTFLEETFVSAYTDGLAEGKGRGENHWWVMQDKDEEWVDSHNGLPYSEEELLEDIPSDPLNDYDDYVKWAEKTPSFPKISKEDKE